MDDTGVSTDGFSDLDTNHAFGKADWTVAWTICEVVFSDGVAWNAEYEM